MFWIIIVLILGIVYCQEIYSFVKKIKKMYFECETDYQLKHGDEFVEQLQPDFEDGTDLKRAIFPNGYSAELVEVLDYENYIKNFSLGHSNRDDNLYVAPGYVTKKHIVFSDGGRITVDQKDVYWDKWLGVHEAALCCHIQRRNADGIVVDSYYLPSSLANLYFKKKVEC